ncbi:glycerophosphodiester phosphodiesterase family protein [unidentified bacterial endosymbiont]|uniref:glycerophosphodiester phosphodiesterase family protein n=1 Tax=unidentified bacterial endosymbiont TaxID=2355 RepID=UPI00209F263F|nr:glycerophosphodiester phosphodiesterase family protein [unidentified bacterial endosymbiont]
MIYKRVIVYFIVLLGFRHPLCFAIAIKPLIIAHRAGLADALENSLSAIDSALKCGSDIIWVSIQLSKDGQPVVYRPDNLNEFTTGEGLVSHKTASQLASLRYKKMINPGACSKFSSRNKQKIISQIKGIQP